MELELTKVQQLAVLAFPLLLGIVLHEVSHGFVANMLGDSTAKKLGRLTLNPIKHIDPIGTILVPALLYYTTGFLFGWAKPVPVDARNLHNPRRDMAFVALAGPVSNLLMALMWGGILKIVLMTMHPQPGSYGHALILMGELGVLLNLMLAVFNLIPIPPMDGSRVLTSLLPPRYLSYLAYIEKYGFFIILALIYFNIIGRIIWPPVAILMHGIYTLFGIAS